MIFMRVRSGETGPSGAAGDLAAAALYSAAVPRPSASSFTAELPWPHARHFVRFAGRDRARVSVPSCCPSLRRQAWSRGTQPLRGWPCLGRPGAAAERPTGQLRLRLLFSIVANHSCVQAKTLVWVAQRSKGGIRTHSVLMGDMSGATHTGGFAPTGRQTQRLFQHDKV